MVRRSFADILNDMKFDVQLEYNSLLRLFYYDRTENTYPTDCPYEMCAEYFRKMPFRGPYIDIMSFDRDHKFDFENKNDVSFEKLLLFCEYVYSYMCNIEKLGIHNLDQKYKLTLVYEFNYVQLRIAYKYGDDCCPLRPFEIAVLRLMDW